MPRNITTFAPVGQFSTLTTPSQVFYFGVNGSVTANGEAIARSLVAVWADRVEADGGTLDASRDFFIASMTY